MATARPQTRVMVVVGLLRPWGAMAVLFVVGIPVGLAVGDPLVGFAVGVVAVLIVREVAVLVMRRMRYRPSVKHWRRGFPR